MLSRCPIILPKKRHYYIETIESQYAHAHNIGHLRKVREIIQEYHSDYLEAFDKHMNERSGHMFNMFIMRYDYFCLYCSWLFDILLRLENKIHDRNRVLGFIGERLLDIWINNKIDYVEHTVIYMEKQNLLNKYIKFIIRKFTHVK